MRLLITGSNRGIGLALTRQYLARGDRVFAACRQPDAARDLLALRDSFPDQLSVGQLDVADPASIEAAYNNVRQQTDALDVLVNNAGIYPCGERLGSLDAQIILHAFAVNSVGPIMVAQRFLDLLRQGERPRIVNITSQLGSLTRKRSGGDYSYTASKAALNMLTKALAYDVRPLGIITVMVHPGWVQTDMGGRGAPLTPTESARGMVAVIDSLKADDAARYLQWDGSELPW